jgi:ATP-dependent Clp protease ATP-binding subunit ClpA
LDEFEKTNSDILNLFLQVFDEGRLTDGLGRTTDFQNAIIIATSNAHSVFIKAELENHRAIKEIAESLKMKLSEYFRPELINRFSDVIVFRDLTFQEIQEVTKIQLTDLAKDLHESQGIKLEFTESAVNQIAGLGYNPVYGARPLRKAISDNIRSVLAEKILRKEIGQGNELRVVFQNNQFEFQVVS